jgi:DNA/RNA endonuclease YhcR with UshA esterase domain
MSRKPLFAKFGIVLLLLAAFCAVVVFERSRDKFIPPEEAAYHIGQKQTVRGRVFEVHASKNGTVFMNMGAPFPDQTFTVVCFKQAVPIETLRKFENRKISVSGEIKEYKGQAEIILNSMDQIK